MSLANIVPNYWYWDYTPTYYSKTNYPTPEKFDQLCYYNLDAEAKASGIYLSGQHIRARYELGFGLGTRAIRWRYDIGIN